MKQLARRLIRGVGFEVSRRDRMAELIPAGYANSPYLPRVYKQSVGRLFYFNEMIGRVSNIAGDVVECGVSIGHGLLYFMLLHDLRGVERRFFGFDSFSGFPASTERDQKPDGSFQTELGDYATPPQIVIKTLTDGRVSSAAIERLRLIPGRFDETVSRHNGAIALLHLDCDLYESYKTCLSALYPNVARGGLVMLDEYCDPNYPGAKQAIDEFFADKPERPEEYFNYDYRRYFVVKS